MYMKKVRRNGNEYSYYYHNFRVNGKVKNVFLGTNKLESLKKLETLITPLSYKTFDKSSKIFIFAFSLTILGFLAYYFNIGNFTGLTIYFKQEIPYLIKEYKMHEAVAAIIMIELIFLFYKMYKSKK